MSSQRNLSGLVFLVLSNFVTFVGAQTQTQTQTQTQAVCGSNGNYTRNSVYQANLNALLSSLSTDIPDNGFFASYAGQDPERVNAIALCRGDVQLDFCRSCVRNASYEVLNSCPNQRDAFVWSEYCTLRYSNQSIFGSFATDPGYVLYNVNNATNASQFMWDLRFLVDDLRQQASGGNSFRKLAAGNRESRYGSLTIYGLVQCTPDLTREDCNTCLVNVASRFLVSEYGAIGARSLATSCNIRYEIRPFYNNTRLQELGLLPPSVPSPVRMPPPPVSSPPGNDGNRISRTIIILVSVAVCVVLVIFFAGFLIRKRIKRKPREEVFLISKPTEEVANEISLVESMQCDFGKIRAATNNFSEANKLGQGGFGSVYKGKLQNDQEIAVKKLSRGSDQGDLEFKNEVMILARLQHRNLVKLLGFSVEGSEKLLVYEFVKNASLDNFIFDETRRSCLDWPKRYNIIGGIAKGILYLHEDSRLRIIHRDLKAGNVLLDGNMNPKIADFGLARLFVPDDTQGSTCRIVGTYGYMAPEYAMHGKFSIKSDVFSFGVLVLEIISGRKNRGLRNEDNVDHLLSSAWKLWSKGMTTNLIDPVLIRESSTIPNLLRCIHIGLLCVQENDINRPTMATVVQMLNSFAMPLPVPSKPSFYMTCGHDSKASITMESISEERSPYKSENNEIANSQLSSRNKMSVTELYPR